MPNQIADLLSRLNKNLNTLESSAATLATWIEQGKAEADTAGIRKQIEALTETTDAIAALLAELVAEQG